MLNQFFTPALKEGIDFKNNIFDEEKAFCPDPKGNTSILSPALKGGIDCNI